MLECWRNHGTQFTISSFHLANNSEIVVKQYPMKLVVINAGGFPKGVTVDNLLTTPSTPRNRLLADILAKTGIVERSGQGMDKIFLNTLSEGKPKPDCSETDDFNVTAKKTLSNKQIAQKLEQMGFLEKRGKTNAVHYILPRRYYELAGDTAAYSLATDWDADQVWAVIEPFLKKYGKAKRANLDKIVGSHVSEKQMRNILDQLKKEGKLKTEGLTNQTFYMLADEMSD